jgi:hypothetical protein
MLDQSEKGQTQLIVASLLLSLSLSLVAYAVALYHW